MARLGKILFALMLLLLISFAGFISWILINPRDVTYAAALIINKLQHDLAVENDFSAAQVVLQWDSTAHKLNAKIIDARFKLANNLHFKTAQLDLRWDILPLLFGQFRRVDISFGEINWHGEDGAQIKDFHQQIRTINEYLNMYAAQFKKASLTFNNFPVPYGEIKKITIKPVVHQNNTLLQINTNLIFAQHLFDINALLDLSSNTYINVKSNFTANTPEHAPFSGEINFLIPEWQQLKAGNFILNLQETKLSGQLDYKSDILESNLLIENQLVMDDLWKYWPEQLLHKTRHWLSTHLKQGTIKAATIKSNINVKEAIKNHKLQKNEIKSDILLTNVKLHYLEDNQENISYIHDASVGIKLDGAGMMITMYQGKLDNLKLKGTTGYIKFTSIPEKEGIAINATLTGDLQESIDTAYQHLQLENKLFKNFSGQAITNVNLFVPFIAGVKLADINVAIKSNLSDVAVNNFLKKYAIDQGSFDLNLQGSKLKLVGNTRYNNSLPAHIFLNIPNIAEPDAEIILSLTTEEEASKFKEMGAQIPKFIDKRIKANLIIVKKSNIWFKNATFDLSNAQITLDELGINKAIGEKALLKVSFLPDINESWQTNRYELELPNTTSAGQLELSANFNSVVKLFSDKTTHHGAKLFLNYNKVANSNEINISGEFLDLSKVDWIDLKESSGYSGENTNIKGEFTQLKMKNGITFLSPSFDIHCIKQKCHTINLKSEIENGGFVKVETDKDFVFIKSNNAGRALAAFNVSNNILGGSMDISGEFDTQGRFNGHAYMQSFSLRKTSVFTKLLLLPMVTATSIFNIPSLFDGSKMFFDLLHCPVHYANGKILLQHCFQENKNLVIKGSGYIDLDRNTIDSQGIIAPKSVINKITGAIPIIGRILSGRNKEGILAISYSISGPLTNPRMSVNPLSVLTPGITRDVFNAKKKP